MTASPPVHGLCPAYTFGSKVFWCIFAETLIRRKLINGLATELDRRNVFKKSLRHCRAARLLGTEILQNGRLLPAGFQDSVFRHGRHGAAGCGERERVRIFMGVIR